MNPFLIIGAGPTGLTLALALSQRGHPVRIIDAKTGPSTHSKALGIHARTLEVFERLGVVSPFLEKGNKATSITFHHGRKKLKLTIDSLADTAYPFVLILAQSQTEKILLAALEKRGVKVEFNTALHSLSSHEATLATGEKIPFKWLIGCDGGKSQVRHCLHLPFTGEELPETFLIVDVKGKRESKEPGPDFFLAKEGLCGVLPFEDLHRLILPLKKGEVIEESLEAVQAAVEKRGVSPCLRVDSLVWFSSFRIHRRATKQFRVDHCFLAGDAAHIHSPAGGQGMNTGIQDAFNLAWKLSFVEQGLSPESLLETYEKERLPISHMVLQGTTRFTKLITFTAKTKLLSLFFFILWLIKTCFRKKILRAMAELSYRYPGKGPFEGPLAGLRMPDCLLSNGKRLHALLSNTSFVILLFKETDMFAAWKEVEVVMLKDPLLLRALNAGENSVFVIRPDGVVGFGSHAMQKEEVENYLLSIFKQPLFSRDKL